MGHSGGTCSCRTGALGVHAGAPCVAPFRDDRPFPDAPHCVVGGQQLYPAPPANALPPVAPGTTSPQHLGVPSHPWETGAGLPSGALTVLVHCRTQHIHFLVNR